MKIIIVGLGKVGSTLAAELSREGNDLTVIDNREAVVEAFSSQYDIMGICGNGVSYSVQMEAGITEADLMIAVTGSDEFNLLCCLIARKAGNCHTIARVRNPQYSTELAYIQEELALAMVINPELAAADEIARVLKYPSAIDVDSFNKSRVELLKFRVPEDSVLDGMRVLDIHSRFRKNILICTIERGNELLIPGGTDKLQARDLVSIAGSASEANDFFRQIGLVTNQIKSIILAGGGTLSYYLAKILSASGIKVKIIEKNEKRCEELCMLLPKVSVVNGDPLNKELMLEEGLRHAEAFAAVTDIDEENILLSLYAKKVGKMKVVTQIKRIRFDEVLSDLDLDTVVYPKSITAEHILRYVRSMNNSLNSNVETLHRIINNKAEALEFYVREESEVTGKTLQELKIRKGILIASITRNNGKVLIPRGQDMIQRGDTVIVITRINGLNDLRDILER